MARPTQLPLLSRIDARLLAWLRRFPILLPWTLGLAFLAIGYWYIFSSEGSFNQWPIFRAVLINVATAWVTGAAFAMLMRRSIASLRPSTLLLLHLVLAISFAFAWYLLNISVQGWAMGSLADGATIRPFRGPAFLWQVFQGFALYGALAGLVHAVGSQAKSTDVDLGNQRLPERLLLKTGDEMVSIEPAEIIAIVAADDYSEVRTARGEHLVRRRLGDFEQDLPSNFVRLHRSAIVNLDRVVRCEPAGSGRITVHLEGTEPVIASRAGAKLLRDRTL